MNTSGKNSYEEYLDQYFFQDDRTVSIFEYTRRAVWRMDQILSSLEFETCDAELIYRYLTRETTPIPFGAYLRRYIYVRVGLEEPFGTVSDSDYMEMIRNAFFENHMKFSFRPTKKSTAGILHSWLNRETVRRETVFLLAFGLRMEEADVTGFLTKSLKETDFDFCDPVETVYWHCLHNHLGYDAAKRLLEEYGRDEAPPRAASDYLESVFRTPKFFLWEEEALKEYLRYLKANGTVAEATAFREFETLYGRVGDLCQRAGDALAAGIEATFYSGIPRNEQGNLVRISESSLEKPFLRHRMSRQRLSLILRRERPVTRFDLISFLFFLYSRKAGEPNRRRDAFIEEINGILWRCHMAGLYFANPYEAFVTMCLMTDDPPGTFAEVWEMSYRNGTDAPQGANAAAEDLG